jgi:hypothetical protein
MCTAGPAQRYPSLSWARGPTRASAVSNDAQVKTRTRVKLCGTALAANRQFNHPAPRNAAAPRRCAGWGLSMKSLLLALALMAPLTLSAATALRDRTHDHEALLGPNYNPQVIAEKLADDVPGTGPLKSLKRWNSIAINASGLDHMPVRPGENRVFGEQVGPVRAARAMAIVHIAMFEAVNAIKPRYRSYVQLPRANPYASQEAALAQAAHDTLVVLFPSQRQRLGARLAADLGRIRNGNPKTQGIALGRRSAQAILALRAHDGSAHAEMRVDVDYVPSTMPGIWRQDPVSRSPVAIGARWNEVRPFVMTSATQFRVPPPPDMHSAAYTAAFDEVKRLGGDGRSTPTERSAEQTRIGNYWAYDGTPSLCAPPRMYNQIATHIAGQMHSDVLETARLLALVNTSMADAGIASWDSKFHYAFWRPVGGIREADAGTGLSGLGDGNPDTHGDPAFMPLGAPASNLNGPNFTPPFPAYPSGHATFGGTLFQTLRLFYGRDDVAFTFVSDEYDGNTIANDGSVRPLMPRSFASFSQAEEENGQSRVYLGIHWAFDKTAGIVQGRRVADFVFQNVFQPL